MKGKLSCADSNTVVLKKVPEFFSHKLHVDYIFLQKYKYMLF